MRLMFVTERSMVRAICEANLKNWIRDKYLMVMLGEDETIGQLSLANKEHWYGHMLRRDYGCFENGISV